MDQSQEALTKPKTTKTRREGTYGHMVEQATNIPQGEDEEAAKASMAGQTPAMTGPKMLHNHLQLTNSQGTGEAEQTSL